jgi:hypothetical protein
MLSLASFEPREQCVRIIHNPTGFSAKAGVRMSLLNGSAVHLELHPIAVRIRIIE